MPRVERKYKFKKMNVRHQERFWKFVDKRGEHECWPWVGTTHPRTDYATGVRKGDPLCFIQGRSRSTDPQRVCLDVVGVDCAPQHGVGSICYNRKCCNPNHLYATGTDSKGNPPPRTVVHAQAEMNELMNPWPVCEGGHKQTPYDYFIAKDGTQVCRWCLKNKKAIAKGREPKY